MPRCFIFSVAIYFWEGIESTISGIESKSGITRSGFLFFHLEKEGFTVFTANNGLKGLILAKEHIPDLIILDVMMP